MNTEAIKTELQQVLESDLALRKEYNEIKRSLSDYRNQLIQRDEDCKRLQVSIDVLNTKLVVMERDNGNYKNEVNSFKELRHTIREQLTEKQDEIIVLLSKIEGLNNQLMGIAAEYETKISTIQLASQNEVSNISASYEQQINELKSNSTYQQSGIRSELESKIAALTLTYTNSLQESTSGYELKIKNLTSEHTIQLSKIESESFSTFKSITESNADALVNLKAEYEIKVNDLSFEWINEKKELIQNYESQLNNLTESFATEKAEVILCYETKLNNLSVEINSLQSNLSLQGSELTQSFQSEIENLTQQLTGKQLQFDGELNSTIESLTKLFSEKEIEIRNEYESKLSSTATNTETQATLLNENLNSVVTENEHYKEKIREMVYHIDAQNTQIEHLTLSISNASIELSNQIESNGTIATEFNSYKQNASLASENEIQNLNLKITDLSSSLSNSIESVFKLDAIILNNLSMINELSNINSNLEDELTQFKATLETEKETFETFKNELELNHQQQLQSKDVEFNKLISENTSLISEIDSTSDLLDVANEELNLVKAELSEIKSVSEGRAGDLKETLQNKNYELTNLSANNMALQTELDILKAEFELNRNQLSVAQITLDTTSEIQNQLAQVLDSKVALESQILGFTSTIETLNENLNEKNTEIINLKSVTKADEQDAFIDRLFKQIDTLSDEKLNLLSEKEQMASQLIKMNDTISTISLQVDSHEIDVTELDNHRKNVILAKSSSNIGSPENTVMKKQINELVREIDKCIALLSA